MRWLSGVFLLTVAALAQPPFREFDYLNNARQTPKLPDYAVVDTTTPPGPRYPGKVVLAGFFNEDWSM